MKKFSFILLAICFALSVLAETNFTFTSAEDLSQTKDDISVVLAKGSGSNAPLFKNEYYLSEYHPEMRLYLGNTITITSDEPMENIQLVFAKSNGSNKEYTGLSASVGTLVSGGTSTDATDWKVDTWTGSAMQVVFTLTGKGQRQIQRVLVDGEPIVIVKPEIKLPTAEDLLPDYVYAEPTTVSVPDTTILKNEYAFIDNNILVHCDMGSIIKATDTTEAYFNCNAEYTITFTATKPIKGLSVDGYVREDFTASATSGNITHLDPPEKSGGEEGYPAFVITDVNATSVTITCQKQLRCYAVRVFFQDNPEPIEIATPDTIDLEMASAEAEDYSDDPDYSSEGSYSYWVKLSSATGYPQVWLDIYAATKGDLSGWYSPYAYNTGSQTYVWFSDGDTDAVTAYDIDVDIEAVSNGYRIAGVLTCWERGYEYTDEGEDLVYRFSYEGPVPFVLPGEEGIETVKNDAQSTKVLRDGVLMIERNGQVYNAQGRLIIDN